VPLQPDSQKKTATARTAATQRMAPHRIGLNAHSSKRQFIAAQPQFLFHVKQDSVGNAGRTTTPHCRFHVKRAIMFRLPIQPATR